jgi:hypothetical protein
MEREVEWFVAITSLVVGASHIVRATDWVEAFRALHRLGRVGALVNGTGTLVVGAAIVAGHRSWAWPAAVVTVFGWLLVAKGTLSCLAPDTALRSIERGSTPAGFRAAGGIALALAAWTAFCLWNGAR